MDFEVTGIHLSLSMLKKPFIFLVIEGESAFMGSDNVPDSVGWKPDVFCFMRVETGICDSDSGSTVLL